MNFNSGQYLDDVQAIRTHEGQVISGYMDKLAASTLLLPVEREYALNMVKFYSAEWN